MYAVVPKGSYKHAMQFLERNRDQTDLSVKNAPVELCVHDFKYTYGGRRIFVACQNGRPARPPNWHGVSPWMILRLPAGLAIFGQQIETRLRGYRTSHTSPNPQMD